MIDPSELAEVPLLSAVGAEDLARLAGAAGDLRLATGEYAVHEGDSGALFVVLGGKIEVVKSVDGILRTIGWRTPGQIFGEVPIAFGTPFQGSYRAAEPARVMRVETRQFYTLAAASPETMKKLTDLARERIGGLQGIATTPTKSRATLVGERHEPHCRALRTFLSRNQIKFEWLLPDAADTASKWPGPALTAGELPAVHCEDGTTLLRATPRDIAAKIGLRTRPPASHEYDTVILGAGPAGLAAAVYGSSEGLRTLVIEREAPGGQAETSSRIENYLGFPTGVSGDELARRALQQANRLGAEIVMTRAAVGIDVASRTVRFEGSEEVRGKTIVIATGVTWRRLAVDGFEELLGKGVHYGASRNEASTTQGRDIHLIGAGNSAGQAAMFFASYARTVTLVVRGDALEKSMSYYLVEQLRGKSNVRIALRSEIKAAHGKSEIEAVNIVDRASGTERREASGGVFVFIGADAETSWLPGDVARDERGYVLTGESVVKAGRWKKHRDPYLLETSVPGIFACGDVRSSPVKRVAAAVGEGSMAIAFIHQFLAYEESPRSHSNPPKTP